MELDREDLQRARCARLWGFVRDAGLANGRIRAKSISGMEMGIAGFLRRGQNDEMVVSVLRLSG